MTHETHYAVDYEHDHGLHHHVEFEDNYRHRKYERDLPQKIREVEEKQHEEDERWE